MDHGVYQGPLGTYDFGLCLVDICYLLVGSSWCLIAHLNTNSHEEDLMLVGYLG